MRVVPPPTPKELEDVWRALLENVPREQIINNPVWFENWIHYLIGLRRGYQNRFISEAFEKRQTSSR